MSRIGKQTITIPEKTEVSFKDWVITVKGPLGSVTRAIRPLVDVKVEGSNLTVEPLRGTIEARALWGTVVAHIQHMIEGVHKAYEKKLIIEGIGYKADVKGTQLHLALGFSHPIHVEIPKDIKVVTEKNTILITGVSKDAVGQFASKIRSLKKPEPYKGKGLRYHDEVIRRKQGKKSV